MERRWDRVWPTWVPRELEVGRPVSEFIREWATITPERIALSFYGRDVTYRELDAMVDRAAWGLVKLGVGRGDRVAIHMENCPQFVVAYFAIQRAGAVGVPLNPMFKQAELEYELIDAAVETLIGLDSLYPEVAKVRVRTPLKNVIVTSLRDFLPEEPVLPLPLKGFEEVRQFRDCLNFTDLLHEPADGPICRVSDLEKDIAIFQYTGGTTGTPKAAMISHRSLAYACVGTAYWNHHREDDVFLAVAPFFHIMGQQQTMCTPLVAGGRVVILARFAPEVAARAIGYYGCTYCVAATTMCTALLSLSGIRGYDLSSLRGFWMGGSPVSDELYRQMEDLLPGAFVGEGYGLTETVCHGGAVTPMYRHKPGFVGIPQLNDLVIMDLETGARELEPGQEGEITLEGPAMMRGYWNRPEETESVLRNGRLYTGDIGLMDEEGYVKLLGRKRELIKCSGYSVFPAEVEDLLCKHPAIQEAAVAGIKDAYRGETPKAFVVLRPPFRGVVTELEILEWCKDNMAAYKRPRKLEFREELPKSAAGKLLRRLLVEGCQ